MVEPKGARRACVLMIKGMHAYEETIRGWPVWRRGLSLSRLSDKDAWWSWCRTCYVRVTESRLQTRVDG